MCNRVFKIHQLCNITQSTNQKKTKEDVKMKNKYQASLSCIKYYCGHYNKAVETAISNLQELIKKYNELNQEKKNNEHTD
jgi:hypothetical protein